MLTFKPNLGVALVFVPFRGEKTKSQINQCPLVLSGALSVKGKLRISQGNDTSEASFMSQRELSWNVRVFHASGT